MRSASPSLSVSFNASLSANAKLPKQAMQAVNTKQQPQATPASQASLENQQTSLKIQQIDIESLLEANLDLGDIVELLIQALGSNRRLSEVSGCSRTVWDGLLNRKTARPNMETFEAMAKVINELADRGDPIYVNVSSSEPGSELQAVPLRVDEWQLMRFHERSKDKRLPGPSEAQMFRLQRALSGLPPTEWDSLIDSTILLWEKWGVDIKSLIALPHIAPEQLYQQVARQYSMDGQGVRNLATLVTQNLAERRMTLGDLIDSDEDLDLDKKGREQLQQALQKLMWQGTLEPNSHTLLIMFLARNLNDSTGNSFNGDIDALLGYCQMI